MIMDVNKGEFCPFYGMLRNNKGRRRVVLLKRHYIVSVLYLSNNVIHKPTQKGNKQKGF